MFEVSKICAFRKIQLHVGPELSHVMVPAPLVPGSSNSQHLAAKDAVGKLPDAAGTYLKDKSTDIN